MKWEVPRFSNRRINLAGRALADDEAWMSPARDAAIETVNNWRASHAFALNAFQVNLRRRSRRLSKLVLVTQRLKRIDSIEKKLRRAGPSSQLTQMQDVGGCRSVLRDLQHVKVLADQYKALTELPNSLHSLRDIDIDDYISSPKSDGYRGVHLACRYNSLTADTLAHHGRRIEVQIRSRLQHIWATAVETVSLFLREDLKAGLGDQRWLRFFALMSGVIAGLEKTEPVPGVPESRDEHLSELKALIHELEVQRFMESCSVGVHITTTSVGRTLQLPMRAHYYVLDLDSDAKTIDIKIFGRFASALAQDTLWELEKQAAGKASRQVLLAKADSLKALRRGYPSYYFDTGVFMDLLKLIVSDGKN